MGTKLIENIDDETWRKFVGHCIANNIKVGEELNRILKKHLQEEKW